MKCPCATSAPNARSVRKFSSSSTPSATTEIRKARASSMVVWITAEARVLRQRQDEGFVDLEFIDWQLQQLRHGGIAHAEVVNRYANPQGAQLADSHAGAQGILPQARLGNLERQSLGIDGELFQQRGEINRESRLFEVQTRDVHAHVQSMSVGVQARHLEKGHSQNDPREGANQSHAFRDGDENVG